MELPRDFLRYDNFELAFTRIVRGGNKEYKAFYRHLFPSFNLALRENLKDLIEELRRGTFEPEKPTVVYQPKKSGILRPLTLLSLRDLIVYQAILNRIAVSFEDEQAGYAFKRTFEPVATTRHVHTSQSETTVSGYAAGLQVPVSRRNAMNLNNETMARAATDD